MEAVNKYGYVKSCEPNSTKERVYGMVTSTNCEVSAKSRTEADKVMQWLTEGEHQPMAIEANAVTLAKSGWCKATHMGYIAYAPVAYRKEMERKALEAQREAQRAEQVQTSNYIGEVGKRLTVALRACKMVTSWETQYGMTFLYKMEDVDGNQLVWFASNNALEDGAKTIKCTVKSHGERDGVKQTVVNRVKEEK